MRVVGTGLHGDVLAWVVVTARRCAHRSGTVMVLSGRWHHTVLTLSPSRWHHHWLWTVLVVRHALLHGVVVLQNDGRLLGHAHRATVRMLWSHVHWRRRHRASHRLWVAAWRGHAMLASIHYLLLLVVVVARRWHPLGSIVVARWRSCLRTRAGPVGRIRRIRSIATHWLIRRWPVSVLIRE